MYALLHQGDVDLGLVDFDEPMRRLFTQGIILGEITKDERRAWNPDDYVSTLPTRCAPSSCLSAPGSGGSWSSTGIEGVHRSSSASGR